MSKNGDHIEPKEENPSETLDSPKPLYELGSRIGGRPVSSRATVGTAPKFLGVACETLKSDRIFEDIQDFVIADT
jgi:hypothetical protein